MKRTFVKRFSLGLAAVILAAPLSLSAAAGTPKPEKDLTEKIRHELVMLPWYGVFDNLSYQVIDGKLTLSGYVTRPTLKSDAENVVKRIAGVASVVNNIEVLPLSPFDDRIRLGVLRAVYGYPALQRYAMGTQNSIRIIVSNGNVTLEGVVANEADRNIANLQANAVFGVFSVTNNLRVGS
jgi:hyperosmotically inducible periplasmic protein